MLFAGLILSNGGLHAGPPADGTVDAPTKATVAATAKATLVDSQDATADGNSQSIDLHRHIRCFTSNGEDRSFAAVGDGKGDDTAPLQLALDACRDGGGGLVQVGPGVYRCTTLRLPSHTTLEILAGGRLLGSSEVERYAAYDPATDTAEHGFGSRWHRALILAIDEQDVHVRGPGTIDGGAVRDPKGEEGMRGPHTILMGRCKQVSIRDLEIIDSGNYATLFEETDDVRVQDVNVYGGWDGVHFRGWKDRPCERIDIEDCKLYTGDDAIAGRYWTDLTIRNCALNSSCNGIRLLGPGDGLTITDCLFDGPGRRSHPSSDRNNMLAGILLQPGAWDETVGLLDHVLIDDCTMDDVACPFAVVNYPGNEVGNVEVSGLRATGVYRCAIALENWSDKPFRSARLNGLDIHYSKLPEGKTVQPPKVPGVDVRPVPAWALFAYRIDTLSIDDSLFTLDGAEHGRPSMVLQDIGQSKGDDIRVRAFPVEPGSTQAGGDEPRPPSR
jgi:hypothetical protein